jgi:hypothetical protein
MEAGRQEIIWKDDRMTGDHLEWKQGEWRSFGKVAGRQEII